MNPTNTSSFHSTPQAPSKVKLALHEGKLDPFDQNYTLTGILKDIETSINRLVAAKKKDQTEPVIDEQQELSILEKVQEQVLILKTIIINNINEIFSSIYPSKGEEKSDHPTDHTDSHRRKNEDQILNKSMTISDFDLEGNNKINAFEVNRESLAHHQKLYSQENAMAHMGKDFRQEIRIEDEGEDNGNDLICYEDEKTIVINKKRYMESLRNSKINDFSPITERPIEQQYSVENALQDQKMVTFGVQDQKRFYFNPYRDNIYVKLMARRSDQLKKSLFSQNSHFTKRVSSRKFNYLQQFNRC